MRVARLVPTESGWVATAASPILDRLSRYPTRTASAVLCHIRTRNWGPTATSGPVSCGVDASVDVEPPRYGYPDGSRIGPWPVELIKSGSRWAR
jgi:hypothetical protein